VRLVEVEAYRGTQDPGSHGFRGPTPRTEVMFGPAGRLYVYFTYGMHWCANVVCGPVGVCEAVLLRAGQPLEGMELMRSRRGVDDERLLAAGPARLAQAMGLSRVHDGASLLRGSRIWIENDDDVVFSDADVSRTRRIGLSAGRGDELEYRWVVSASPYASRRT
jgi:DNA-3-methyladenine glycosylase